MSEKIKIAVFIAVPFLFYFVSSHFLTKSYYENSLERYEFCLEQIKDSSLPISFCSQISSASDAAYSWATSFYQPIIIMLMIIILSFGHKLFSVNKELKEIKEKLNV